MPVGDRIIEIASSPARVALDTGRLVIRREGMPDSFVPVAEVGTVLLAHPQAIITTPAMQALMAAGASVMVCDSSLLPCGLMLPLNANTLQTQRMLLQVQAKVPLHKRLWQQVVRSKIRAQAATLSSLHSDDGDLRTLADRVQSGDPKNVEATAAVRYWPLLFRDPEFRRRHEAEDQNRLLNYGYAIIRAAMGRAICAAGLHPSLGIHHRSRSNPWCLADDLMEPYRPLIDHEVASLAAEYGRLCPLDSDSKRRLISVLELRVSVENKSPETRAVADTIQRTAQSLAKVYAKEADRLEYPHGVLNG